MDISDSDVGGGCISSPVQINNPNRARDTRAAKAQTTAFKEQELMGVLAVERMTGARMLVTCLNVLHYTGRFYNGTQQSTSTCVGQVVLSRRSPRPSD